MCLLLPFKILRPNIRLRIIANYAVMDMNIFYDIVILIPPKKKNQKK